MIGSVPFRTPYFEAENKPVSRYWIKWFQSLKDGVDNLGFVAVPSTATSPGVAGQMAFSSGFLYVCIATNTWKRTALSTF